jgi:hypothetical protein
MSVLTNTIEGSSAKKRWERWGSAIIKFLKTAETCLKIQMKLKQQHDVAPISL